MSGTQTDVGRQCNQPLWKACGITELGEQHGGRQVQSPMPMIVVSSFADLVLLQLFREILGLEPF